MHPKTPTAALLAALAVLACGNAPENVPEPVPPSQPVAVPDQDEDLTIAIAPRSGPAGTAVEVTASGFAPGADVDIGFGPPQSEYEVIGTATATDLGVVDATVHVPSWAEGGRDYVFVAAGPGFEEKVVSDPFRVE